jgi:XTP/dITP diphosphohydrolase
MPPLLQLYLASSNPGKMREYRLLAGDGNAQIELLPDFEKILPFDETAPTFAENAAGKAEHYSRFTDKIVVADDSGIVVPALGGAPGVLSARYAGPGGSDSDRTQKLLREMKDCEGEARRARFVCVTAIARRGRAFLVVSDAVDGVLVKEPRGTDGFGYDPIFFLPEIGLTYAEASREQKNRFSHRGKAFRKAMALLADPISLAWVE